MGPTLTTVNFAQSAMEAQCAWHSALELTKILHCLGMSLLKVNPGFTHGTGTAVI
jgi:hypothetical protein